MGAVFRPKDFGRNYKKLIDNSLEDLSPNTKDDVYKLFNTWEGTTSEEKLMKIIGPERMEKLSKEIKKNLRTLNEDEKEDVKNIFKDSLTFD
jgi:hypothetical protein